MSRSVRLSTVLVAVLGLVLGACGQQGGTGGQADDDVPDAGSVPDAYAYDELRAAMEHMETFGLHLATGIDEHADLSGDPHARAAEVLATVDFLLREHTILTAYAAADRIAGREEHFLAAEHALSENTEALVTEFAALYERSTAEEFERLWEAQVLAYLRYAQAVRSGEETGKQDVREELEAFAEDLSEFVMDATGGLPDREPLHEAVSAHVEHTLEVIDAQRSDDEGWWSALPPAVDQAKELSEHLAGPIATDRRLAGDLTSEIATLRAELSGRLMEEPAFVAAATQRALGGETAAFDAARALVDENTRELHDLVAKHLGDGTADAFEESWTRHNDLLVDYARTLGENGAPQDVLEELAAVCGELGRLFEEATGGALTASSVEKECATHVETVTATIDAQADTRV